MDTPRKAHYSLQIQNTGIFHSKRRDRIENSRERHSDTDGQRKGILDYKGVKTNRFDKYN